MNFSPLRADEAQFPDNQQDKKLLENITITPIA
jgi:hypothetical protein